MTQVLGLVRTESSLSIDSFPDSSSPYSNDRYANAHLSKEEATALAYFDNHHVFENLDSIMVKLLQQRPENPEQFLLDELRLWDGREAGDNYTAVLLQNKPPVATPTSKSPTRKGANLLFNPQFQVLETEEERRKQQEEAALATEVQRAKERYEAKPEEEHSEKFIMKEETARLQKLLNQFAVHPEKMTPSVLENTLDMGSNGQPLLSMHLLRYVIGLGLSNDESNLSKNALRFYKHHMANANVIPLNHSVRLSYEGPLHIGTVHSFHHHLTPHLLPMQAPSVCYQSVHKLFLEYAVLQGSQMAAANSAFIDMYASMHQSADVESKGMHVSFQFRLLIRLCHTWLTVLTEPVREWPRLLHAALYSLIGYEGVYLHTTLVKDLGRLFETTAVAELQNALRSEKGVSHPCSLALQMGIRWVVLETVEALQPLYEKDESLMEEGSLEQKTVQQYLEAVIAMTRHRPLRYSVPQSPLKSSETDSTSRNPTHQGNRKGMRALPSGLVPLNFRNYTVTELKTEMLTSRGCLVQLSFSDEIIELYSTLESSPFGDVADQMDILSFGERDDLAILLALLLRMAYTKSHPEERIDHMTDVSVLTPHQFDILFMRAKLIIAFVDAVLLLQKRSTARLLSTGVISPDFSCVSFPPILMKCMVPQPNRPTLLEVLLKRYRFCTLDSLSNFMGTVTKVMMGLGGMQRSIFEASVSGIIFINYVELVQIMARYLRETETTSVVLLFVRWNRLVRQAITSVISLCIYHRLQSFSDSIKQSQQAAASSDATVIKVLPMMSLSGVTGPQSTGGGNGSDNGDAETIAISNPTTTTAVESVNHGFADALIERELFTILRRRSDENYDTGIFMDSIMNPTTRERLTGQESCFMVCHWDYVRLGVQFRNTALWFQEFISKVTIMVQHDISPDEIVKMATVPLLFAKGAIEALEQKEHQQQADRNRDRAHGKPFSGSTSAGQRGFSRSGSRDGTAPLETSKSQRGREHREMQTIEFVGTEAPSTSPGSSASKQKTEPHEKKKGLSQQEVFDMVVCSYASFSHLLGAFLHEIHTSECTPFIFLETSTRWNKLRSDERELLLTSALPSDVNFSSSTHEQARKDLQPSLTKIFSGDVTRETVGKLVVVLFNCGVIPCRHFDFFSSLQKRINRHLGTPHAPPYFTHLAHRLLKYPLFHVERQIDADAHTNDKMQDAWEEFLRDPSSVFEATRAIIDLIPRSIILENDVAILREKLRTAPQKYIQMFSARAKEKDIMSISIWFRLHTGIPPSFIEVVGITLFDVFLASYDAPYDLFDETKLIQRIDRAFRIILSSTQPRMEELERLHKVVTAAVAPRFHSSAQRRRLHKLHSVANSSNHNNADAKNATADPGVSQLIMSSAGEVLTTTNHRGSLSMTFHHDSMVITPKPVDPAQQPTPPMAPYKPKGGSPLTLVQPLSLFGTKTATSGRSPTTPLPPEENQGQMFSFQRHHNTSGSPHSHRHRHRSMRLFERLMNEEVTVDKNAWRCHPLSVHLVYAVTHARNFAQRFYAEATQQYLIDLCFLLRYVSVESYLRYFMQLFVRLLVIGLEPALIRDITNRLFDTLEALEIPFDSRMPTVLSIVLNVHLERSHDEVEQCELILSKVRNDIDREAYQEMCTQIVVTIPLNRLHVFRVSYMGETPQTDDTAAAMDLPESAFKARSEADLPEGREGAKSPGVKTKTESKSKKSNKNKADNALEEDGNDPVVGSPLHACAISSQKSNLVVNQVHAMLKDVVDEVFYLLTRLATVILEKVESSGSLDEELTLAIDSDNTARRGLLMLLLLSAGTTNVGFKFIRMFGEYLQTEHLSQQLVGEAPILVWSRVMSILTIYLTKRAADTFEISEMQDQMVGGGHMPRDFHKLNMEEVLTSLHTLEASLNPSGTTDGVYLCGSVKRYYSEISSIVYAFLQDSKMDRQGIRQICRRLSSRMEGTTDDIVIGSCCVVSALSKVVKGEDWQTSWSHRPKEDPDHETKPSFAKVIFSCAQRLIREYDNYLRETLELFLSDRQTASTTLDHALTAPHPPIPFREGVPISIDMLMPSQTTLVKQGLISTLLNCVKTIYLMDEKAATQIEQRHESSLAALQRTENKGLLQMGAETEYPQSFDEFHTRRGSLQKDGPSLPAAVPHNVRVLSFTLYGDMLITDSLTETLFTSGLMTADVIRFVSMFDDSICISASSEQHVGSSRPSAPRHSTYNTRQFTPEGELLRSVWQNLLCLVSQNLRRTISHSKISITKEIGNKTVKAFMRLQSLIYIDLLRSVEHESEFVEWLGSYVRKRPLFEEWLLPVLLRAACVVDEKAVVNMTKHMRNDTRDLNRQQKEQREAAIAAANAAAEKAAATGQMIEGNLLGANRSTTSELAPTGKGSRKNRHKQIAGGDDAPSTSQVTAQRAVVTQRLPLSVVQDILLDVLHPNSQASLICVLKTIAKNAEGGYDLQRHLARAFFYQFSHQRLVHLTRRWCLADHECVQLTDMWKKFREVDRSTDYSAPRAPNMPPPSALAKELSIVMEEPLEHTEAFVLFLDHLLITHLKSIFRWNSAPASLCAMFIYTDSQDFHRAIYFLQSRWCVVAITICNALCAWGQMTSEKQYVAVVRVLRGVRLMKCVLQRMRSPNMLLSYLRVVPYQRLLDLSDTGDITVQALSAAPSSVNLTVVENSLRNLVENFKSLLLSLRAICERLAAGQNVTVRSPDLLHLFMDWANLHSSQGKDATRASFRGLVLLISTSLNELCAEEALSIFEKRDVVRQFDGPFGLRCGLGNAILADHLRMFFAFAMVSCNGLRDLVMDETLISTTHLPEYASKEIRIVLPNFADDVPGSSSDLRKPSLSVKELSQSVLNGSSKTFSRAFVETCIVAAIGHLMEDVPITFSQSRSARLAESEIRDSLLQLLEMTMDFVVLGLKKENAILNNFFAAYQDRLTQRINPEVVCYEEVCLVCYFLMQEIKNRGRLQLSSVFIKSCDHLIATFCRSLYGFFYNNSGERLPHLLPWESKGTTSLASSVMVSQTAAPFRSLTSISGTLSMAGASQSHPHNTSTTMGWTPGHSRSVPPSLFLRAQWKVSSGLDMAAIEAVVLQWQTAVRRRHASQFPVADIKIFCHIWVSMLFDLLSIFIETVPVYLEAFQSMTRHDSTAEELRLFFIFLHRMAFTAVAEEWLVEPWVEARIREWIVTMEPQHPPRESGEEDHDGMQRHNMEVATCAIYAISATVGRRVIRSGQLSSRKGVEESSGQTVSSSQGAPPERGGASPQSVAAIAAAKWGLFFHQYIRPAWVESMTYFLRRLSDVQREGKQQAGHHIGMLLQDQLHAPNQAETEVLQAATVAESSLLKSAIKKTRLQAGVGLPHSGDPSSNTAAPQAPKDQELSLTHWDSFLESTVSSTSSPNNAVTKPDNATSKDRFKKAVTKHANVTGSRSAAAEKGKADREKFLKNTLDRNPRVTDGFVTLEELAAAHTPECTWTAINGIVYDITKFVMMHPGGAEVLIEFCAGQDCTERFVQQHLGDERVLRQLEVMRIGVMKE